MSSIDTRGANGVATSGADDGADVIVIGAGPGGYVAAIRAAQHGMSVIVVERDRRLGGRCLREACIPAKAVLRSADVFDQVAAAADAGIRSSAPVVDFDGVARHRDGVIDTLGDGVSFLLRKNAVRVVTGTARLGSGGVVEVDGEPLEARRGVILATGSVPVPLPGTEFGGPVLDTAAIWSSSQQPASLVVIGAGPSGIEVASAFARLGSTVTLVDRAPTVLPGEDHDIVEALERQLRDQGIELVLGAAVEEIDPGDDSVTVRTDRGSIVADRLVVAVGRRPDVDALGLAEAGIDLDDRGHVVVDGHQRTSIGTVHAIGDLCAGPALAHKASAEGIVAADALAGVDAVPVDHDSIPRATFCRPNVASIGLTEAQALEAYDTVSVGRVPYAAAGAAVIGGRSTGFVKIITDTTYGELLGAHAIGERATELVQQIANVRALEGGSAELARIIHGHPTLGELVSEAARSAEGWLVHG